MNVRAAVIVASMCGSTVIAADTTQPASAPAASRPADAKAQTFTPDYHDAKATTVLEDAARAFGCDLIVQGQIPARVTVTSQKALNEEDAVKLLDAMFSPLNYDVEIIPGTAVQRKTLMVTPKDPPRR
jgi:hypothetical protein